MNFLDGVLISSCFWFFIVVFALLLGFCCGYDTLDEPHLSWTDTWDSGFEAGYEATKYENNEARS